MVNSVPPSNCTSDIPELAQRVSTLVSRNLVIKKHRTSVLLEPEMWAALKDISKREHATMHDVCSLVADHKTSGSSLTAAIRVFIVAYFRHAATDDGHSKAGHGHGIKLLSTDYFAINEAQPVGATLYTLSPKNSSGEANIVGTISARGGAF